MKFLIFDTETNGFIKGTGSQRVTPAIVSIAWVILEYKKEEKPKVINQIYKILKRPDVAYWNPHAYKVHGISQMMSLTKGHESKLVFQDLLADMAKVNYVVGHNLAFDDEVFQGDLKRHSMYEGFKNVPRICTLESFKKYNQGKKISLENLYLKLIGKPMAAKFNAHNALDDVKATTNVLVKLLQGSYLALNDVPL